MKKVLVLSYHDHPADGHAMSRYRAIKEKGYDAYFLSLISLPGIKITNSFLDKDNKYTIWYLGYIIKLIISRLLRKKRLGADEYSFFNYSNFYAKNAAQILKKSISNPDVIIFGWCDFFISPRTTADLYHLTKAKIVIPMVDAHILGGGCHYPCNCNQFKTGCKSCPALQTKSVAKRLYDEKLKYLSDIPFVLAGTSYDLKRAKEVPFLKNKEMLPIVGAPEIPFVKNKIDARKIFGIAEDEFVILCGAVTLSDKRKGFQYFIDSIDIFSKSILDERKVTLLLPSDNNFEIGIKHPNISIITPGFLQLEQLFNAYYASDIFISPSIDDSGPYMVNYSIACGTPVISFPIGVALDLVQHKKTGYLANYLDSQDLAKGIYEFYKMSRSELDIIRNNCLSLMEKFKKITPWYFKVLE